jgi:hypothetical protein
MSIIEELHRARKERLARFRQATLQHFDRCYDEALASLPEPPPPPPPKPKPSIVFENVPAPMKMPLHIVTIQGAVAARFGVTRSDFLGPSRKQDVVVPRHVAMFLLRELAGMSLQQIGQRFGGKDHTTVLNGCERTVERMASDPKFAAVVNELREELTE